MGTFTPSLVWEVVTPTVKGYSLTADRKQSTSNSQQLTESPIFWLGETSNSFCILICNTSILELNLDILNTIFLEEFNAAYEVKELNSHIFDNTHRLIVYLGKCTRDRNSGLSISSLPASGRLSRWIFPTIQLSRGW